MIQKNIPARVINLIIEKGFVFDSDEVTPEAHIKDDLGADSLDLLEMMMDIESEFNISIPDEVAEKITTVQSVITCVEERAGGK